MRPPLRQAPTIAFALLLAGWASEGLAQPVRQAAPAAVAGRVTGKSSPLVAAGVYAYQLADLTLHKVSTDTQGNFLFRDLPAGLYKVIAHKAGFLPAVVLLTRTTAQSHQFVELQLAAAESLAPHDRLAGEDFWSLRARIPADVLRDIQRAEAQLVAAESLGGDGRSTALEEAPFQASMAAMTGLDQVPGAGEGQISRGRLGIEGRLGDLQVGLSGDYWQLAPGAAAGHGMALRDAQASAVSLEVGHGPDSRLNLSTRTSRLSAAQDGGDVLPVGLEQYRVSWSQALGENGRSQFAAQYTTENNYHRHGGIDPIDIPEASRTWGFEGSYATSLGERADLAAGVRYRERQAGDFDGVLALPGDERVDLFGRGGLRVQPAVLVEYGLYTTFHDGTLSLTPRGGVVVQLGDAWQAAGSVSQRAYEDPGPRFLPDFVPTLYQEPETCEQAGDDCYELRLSRQRGEDDLFSVSAVQRTLGETLRLYFSEDVFDRFDSLYLVRGDRLRELQVEWSRRLAPQVYTRFESSLAEGGGGRFRATDAQPYENQVRYAVSSLDTRFTATSTGVFLAFHQLSQELRPVHGSAPAPRKLERLQLQVSQDLNVLLDLAAEWAVQLDMELSRGATSVAVPTDDEESLRRRIMGGIAVKF